MPSVAIAVPPHFVPQPNLGTHLPPSHLELPEQLLQTRAQPSQPHCLFEHCGPQPQHSPFCWLQLLAVLHLPQVSPLPQPAPQ